MSECYDSTTLIGVLNQVREPQPFLLRTFFPDEITFETESVEWHIISGGKRPAPFVHPCVQGQLIADRGWEEISLKPAYVKPKSAIDCCKPFRRRAGDVSSDPMSPQERYDAAVAEALNEQAMMIDTRLEWMAAKALVAGAYTIEGEKYKTTQVDFRRAAVLTKTLAGPALWSATTATPVQDIERWSVEMQRTPGGAPATHVVMASDAWQAVRFHHEFNDALDTSFAGQTGAIDRGPNGRVDASFKGTLGSFQFWTYDEFYEDNDGVQHSFMPSGTVLLISDVGLNGVQCFGAIKDHRFLRAARMWPKQWLQEDPSETYVMTQSAPLVAPVTPNASLSATVL